VRETTIPRVIAAAIKLPVDCRTISAQDGGKQGQGGESPGRKL
jgi:hypothetical protein